MAMTLAQLTEKNGRDRELINMIDKADPQLANPHLKSERARLLTNITRREREINMLAPTVVKPIDEDIAALVGAAPSKVKPIDPVRSVMIDTSSGSKSIAAFMEQATRALLSVEARIYQTQADYEADMRAKLSNVIDRLTDGAYFSIVASGDGGTVKVPFMVKATEEQATEEQATEEQATEEPTDK